MVKQRYISTAIWDDDWFVEELNHKEKLFYFYLLTNEHTNVAGIYKVSVRKIALETGFEKSEVIEILKSLEKSGKVYYRHDHIIMTNWPKHQNWEKSEKLHKGLRAVLIRDTPQKVIETINKENIPYQYPIDTLSNGIDMVCIPPDTSFYKKDLDSDSDSDFDSELENNKPGESDDSQDPPELSESEKEAGRLAQLLNDLHSQEDPGYSGNVKAWVKDIEKLIRIDKRDPGQIEWVLRWCKTPGNFWFQNIMSGKKLREKFPTLISQIQRDRNKSSPTPAPLRQPKKDLTLTQCPKCGSVNLIPGIDRTRCQDCKQLFELVGERWIEAE